MNENENENEGCGEADHPERICIPESLRRILREHLENHKPTPSERIVSLAKSRDFLYDLIQRESEGIADEEEVADFVFRDSYVGALKKAKDLITARIKDLLDNT